MGSASAVAPFLGPAPLPLLPMGGAYDKPAADSEQMAPRHMWSWTHLQGRCMYDANACFELLYTMQHSNNIDCAATAGTKL
jgi:hypothetical protein